MLSLSKRTDPNANEHGGDFLWFWIGPLDEGQQVTGRQGADTSSEFKCKGNVMPGMALSLSELRNLTDDELVEKYDHQAKSTVVGTQYFIDELNRRYQERQTTAMLRFTKWITAMTIVITIATLSNVGLTVALLLQS